MPFDLVSGRFVPEKTNIWRDCVDGHIDWVKEHVAEGAPLNESDHCGDPPLVLAAGNGHLAVVKYLIDEGADLQQFGVVSQGVGARSVLYAIDECDGCVESQASPALSHPRFAAAQGHALASQRSQWALADRALSYRGWGGARRS